MAVEQAEARGCPVKDDAPAGRPAGVPPGCPAHAHSPNGVEKSTAEAQPPEAEPDVEAEAKPMKCAQRPFISRSSFIPRPCSS